MTIPPSTAGEQDWEVIHDQLNDSRTSYQDCKSVTSRYGDSEKEYSYSVYYIKEVNVNGERVVEQSERAYAGLDRYGPTHTPDAPRNVRLTLNSQSRRTLAWDAAPHYGLILEQVLEGRRGSLTDPWLTGYMVERLEYTVLRGTNDPDNYWILYVGDWEVLRPASDNNTSRSFTDNENVGDKTYVYRVRAVNAAGDFSGYWTDDWQWMDEDLQP